ncbi:MAG TPA: hypothetical protein VEY87_06500 [Gaiellaceae bacterium]|nr:hypothetical protein [Gaiellaceae bacterium]
MEAAQLQTGYALSGTVVEAVRVKQDGQPFALLMSAADGSAFTVTATFAGSATVRVYTFATAAETNAFLTDTADSFGYLGCNVERT